MVVFGSYTMSNASNFAQLPYFMKLMFVSTPFYPKLDNNQITQLMSIVQNTHLTQEQLGEELIKWGTKQPTELQKYLEAYGVAFLEHLTRLSENIRTYQFTSEAEPYGNKIKEIEANNKITILESDKQISDVLDSAPPHIQSELARFIFWLQIEFMTMVRSLSTIQIHEGKSQR